MSRAPVANRGRLGVLLLLVGTSSACSMVGYPSGQGDGSSPPDIVPASPVTRPSTAEPMLPDSDGPLSDGASTAGPAGLPAADDPVWRVPEGVRAPDPGHVYEVFGVTYQVRMNARGYDERGQASWYGDEFDGRPTATGETFDMYGLSGAHRTLPLHSFVEVTNLDNGARVVLRINDRGPFASTDRRIIDLSYGAARRLGTVEQGIANVRVRAIEPPGR